MKRIVLCLLLVSVFAGMCFATELGGKWGVGDRNGSPSVRYFFNNCFAGDVIVSYQNVATAGRPSAYETDLGLSGFYVKEIADKTLLESGVMLTGYSGGSNDGSATSGLFVNPFVGFEYLASDHFGADFKFILAGFGNDLSGSTRTIVFTGIASSIGMHYYF